MTNQFGFIAGLAVSATKEMIAIYQRKYGKYGEAVVKKLEKKLLAMAAEIDALHAENERLTAELKTAKVREKVLLLDIENLKKQAQTLDHLRDVHHPAGDENPF